MSGTEQTRASGDGRKLIAAWELAVDRHKRARAALDEAIAVEKAARQALTKWLAPADARPGEKFCIWERDRHGKEVLFEIFIGADGSALEAKYRR